MRLPDLITFTGVDDHTDIAGMAELTRRYPIEWGVLFSAKRQGVEPRYPSGAALSRLLCSGLPLAAHICGSWGRCIMSGEALPWFPVDLAYFRRVQVNHAIPEPPRIIQFRNGWGRFRCIAQTRSAVEFPADTSVDWLFDPSGGRGLEPSEWPPHPGGNRLVGYAGGINPNNVRAVIESINSAGPYWLDVESGVRTNDRFDLSLCRSVCHSVFG